MMILGCGTGSIPHQNRVRDVVTDLRADERVPGTATEALPWRNARQWIARCDPHDIATVVLLAALLVIALLTYRDYAISNDEGVQHRYGELIIAYYRSGFKDQALFHFQNLYLYGGLFDVIAIALSQSIPIDPYDLRHILCALIGIGGIGAAAATARLIAGPRAGLIAAISLTLCGAWYGSMFNHTKDIPFAAAMMGATLFLIRIARRLPSPRAGDIATIRPAGGRGAWHSGYRLAAGRLCRLCDRPVSAASVAGPQPHGCRRCDQIDGAVVARAGARLYHHDPGLALGGAGAAQPVPWPSRLLRVQLFGIRTVLDRPDLRHGGCAAAVCTDLRHDSRAAVDAVRRGADDGCGASAAWHCLREPATVQGHHPALADRDFSAGLPGDLPRPGLHRVTPFPVLDPVACGAGRYRSRQGDCGARRRAVARRYPRGLAIIAACLLWDAATLVRLHPYEYLYYNSAGRRPRRRVAALRSRLLVRQHARGHQPSRSLFAPHRAWQRSLADATSTRSPCAANASRSRKRSRFPSSNGISGRNGASPTSSLPRPS